MFTTLKKWAGFVKFSHTVFAMPFALASMVVAARDQNGWPGWRLFGLIIAALVCARTCAMAFNRIADRHFDQANPRTAGRHLPTGQISLWSAWTLCVGSGLGLIVVSHFINAICFYLSPVALFFVCFYSLTKRFTDFTHVFLGIALALAPVGAWLAVKGDFDFWPLRESAILPILLALTVVFWLVGFDIIYALQDFEFDRQHGLHSLVVRWGPKVALQAAFLSHMFMIVFLALFGVLAGFRMAFYVGLAIIALSVFLEHLLARWRKQNWLQNAFFRLNAVISVVFLTVTVAEVVFPWFRVTR